MAFTATVGYEYPSRLGPPLPYTVRDEVLMQRPDRLRVITPGDGQASQVFSDGRTIMAFAPERDPVAIANKDVFLQIWIGVNDKLPRRIRAVYAADRLRLRHQIDVHHVVVEFPGHAAEALQHLPGLRVHDQDAAATAVVVDHARANRRVSLYGTSSPRSTFRSRGHT